MSNIKTAAQIKGIKSRLDVLYADRSNAHMVFLEAKNNKATIEEKISRLEDELTRIQAQDNGPPNVTEHALIQFLRRTDAIDFDAVASQIMDDSTIELVAKLGNGKYPINGTGLKAVVKNNAVVTVV